MVSDRARAGVIRRMSEGTARYVPYRRPDPGAPNVVIVVLDDIGFAQLGCFGSAIATPNIDRLAARRASLQPVPRDVDLLLDQGGPAQRAQPPRRRHGHDDGNADGLPRLHRADPEVGGAAAPDPARRAATARWRSASGTCARAASTPSRGPDGPLAARPGLRAVLRVPRRRRRANGTRRSSRTTPSSSPRAPRPRATT